MSWSTSECLINICMENSQTILTNQVHPGDSSTETVTGTAYKGDGYYGRADGLHTVQYNLTGFNGTIQMQASLALAPTDDDWFTVSGPTHTSTDSEGSNSTGGFIYNFTGNFVWVRVYVSDWTDGDIRNILLNH